jgi:DNA polymerase-3 subunit alpha
MTTAPADANATPQVVAAEPNPLGGGFVHLHNHTEHSKQDGLSRLGDLAKKIADLGMPAGAMTDHGTTAGTWRWVKECKKVGIKPILGVEAYMALVPNGLDADGNPDPEQTALAWDDPAVRFARTTRKQPDAETGKVKKNTNNHLTILAENETGWRNLCAITNAAEDSFFHKPLIDYALLKEHGEGLIILSGCLGGPVASYVSMARQVAEDGTITWDETALNQARTNLDHLIECVGRENVYVEIMEHGLGAEGWDHIVMLARLAKEAGVEIVATNDAHFIDCEDHDHHDSWLVAGELQRGNKVSKTDPDRWRFNGSGYHLRDAAEMRAIYADKKGWQRACDNTLVIADRIQGIDDEHPYGVIPFIPLRLPTFPVPVDYVAQWEAGEPATFTDAKGKDHAARSVNGKVYRSPSAWMLHEKVREGAKSLYGSFTPALKTLLAFEEGVIQGAGISDYFLIVADIIEWSRSDRGIPNAEFPNGEPGAKAPIYVGPGRGSAAGSAIAYAMGITKHVEPMANGLLFERFLDPERAGMPDIDVDFEANRRDEVYAYAAAVYGYDKVARIGAFQGMKSKRAIKDAARILGLEKVGEKMAGLVPKDGAVPMPFAQIFEEKKDKDTGLPIPCPQGREFREFVNSSPEAQRILPTARAFESVVAGESIHAAGVIISDEPLNTLLPMRKVRAKGALVEGAAPIALWDGKDCDSFGLLKLDALGLINLDYMHACVDNIALTRNEVLDPAEIPHPNTEGDKAVDAAFSLMRAGRTQSIFQLASSGMTELCLQVSPTKFEDLSALVALYRPGPMGMNMHTMYADRKNGRADVDYGIFTDDPTERDVISAILDETYGVIAYQESLMVLAAQIAGFDAGEKNRLRKAFSKKDRDEMDALESIFIERGQTTMTLPDGSQKVAFAKKTLDTLWITFKAAADYLFNKSHSAAYGYLAYQTAYLKANYPVEYAAAVLAIEKKKERRKAIIADLHDEGIRVLPPDINKSHFDTRPDPEDPTAVRFGLKEIRDVGSNAKQMIAERDANGPYKDIFDFAARMVKTEEVTNETTGKVTVKKTALVTVSAIEGLVEAGAFDEFGPRLGHMIVARAATVGQVNGMEVPDAEWGALERANRQRVRLGFNPGESPLTVYSAEIAAYVPGDTVDYWTGEDSSQKAATVDEAATVGANGHIIGLMTGWTEKTTKKGDRMGNFVLEGEVHSIEGVVFPRTFAEWATRHMLPSDGTIVAIDGALEKRTFYLTNDEGEEEEHESLQIKANKAHVLNVPNLPTYNVTRLGHLREVALEKITDGRTYRGRINVAREMAESGAPVEKAKPKTPAEPKPEASVTPIADRKKPEPAAPVTENPEPATVADLSEARARALTLRGNTASVAVASAEGPYAEMGRFVRPSASDAALYLGHSVREGETFAKEIGQFVSHHYWQNTRALGYNLLLRIRPCCTCGENQTYKNLPPCETCEKRFFYVVVLEDENVEAAEYLVIDQAPDEEFRPSAAEGQQPERVDVRAYTEAELTLALSEVDAKIQQAKS